MPGNQFITNDGIHGEVRESDESLAYAVARARAEAETARYQARVVRHSPEARMPTRAYEGDAGFDLYYAGDETLWILGKQLATVPSRVAVQLPEGMWGLIIGRSSSFQKGLLVNPTVIDAGFRGDLFAYCRNVLDRPVAVEPGDRIAQFVPMPLLAAGIQMVEVSKLDESDRGTNGFGSSGR